MSPAKPKQQPAIADDIIWGVAGKSVIAAELDIPEAKAYYLIARGVIPVRHVSATAQSPHHVASFTGTSRVRVRLPT